jgi:hypothetical protein
MIDRMSTKKRDTMVSAAKDGFFPDPSVIVAAGTPLTMMNKAVDGTNVHAILQCPTYRFLVPNNAAYEAYRTSTRPFMKGLAETYTMVPNDSSVWWHRRIVFALKSPLGTATIQAAIGAQTNSSVNATYRVMRDLSGQTTGDYHDLKVNIEGFLFQGTVNNDWTNVFSASLDRTRVDVMSDTRTYISSGNAAAKPRVVKRYVPLNKTLVYDDDENLLTMTPSPLSVQTKAGMGNLFVYDLFNCPAPVSPGSDAGNSAISVSSTQTLYWHEK